MKPAAPASLDFDAVAATSALREDARCDPSRLADYYELTKPRMNFLVVVTTAVGLYLAAATADLPLSAALVLHALGGTALVAASASALNQLVERDRDARMRRTQNRPVAARRMTAGEAAVFAALLGVGGTAWLALAVNPLTAALGAFTLLTYVGVYTPLKTRSPLCTLVGAVPGAVPPMMGVTAVAGTVTPLAWALFAVLFAWQLPHFYALALMFREDYAAGGFKMLPCLPGGEARARFEALAWAAVLVPISLLPVRFSGAGWPSATAAVVLGLLFFAAAIACWRRRPGADRRLFVASIAYLPLLLGAILLDQ